MLSKSKSERVINQRVRAILLTGRGSALLIKRVKPHKRLPYWVAPGGGVESWDSDLIAALERELFEELGARAIVLDTAFVLEHYKAGKQLEEHFFVCMLQDYDLSKRYGPEFTDPARGEYIPQEVPLDALALCRINIKTQQLRDWMLRNLDSLRDLQRLRF
ncbi:MAG: NUDIX domain-containing protein [Chloroflexi bacterium]|nr:NUDIX domain-containing protein [Chloroflexota bacterium]MCY3582684.1 NUDIX domain-containing protein [Chloroflexota bacterium]MCY3714843.1 NUDIX domain-containing protein [Chloroflexota bacterium]MDE2649092.1 NUDIX domain-containing protein [Chloroflexota bacterium]